MVTKQQSEEDLKEELTQWVHDFGDRVFELSQRNLVEEGKTDTSHLLKTANIIKRDMEVEIVYPAPYAIYVHEGRAAGSTPPPVQPIINWARRKKLDNPVSAGHAIAKAIGKRGIQPTPFLKDALDTAKAEIT